MKALAPGWQEILHPPESSACAITGVTTELIESRGEIIPLLSAWMNKHSVSALIFPLRMQANNDIQFRMGALIPSSEAYLWGWSCWWRCGPRVLGRCHRPSEARQQVPREGPRGHSTAGSTWGEGATARVPPSPGGGATTQAEGIQTSLYLTGAQRERESNKSLNFLYLILIFTTTYNISSTLHSTYSHGNKDWEWN